MADREKVIKGLECCMKWTGEPDTATCRCSDCSYTNMDIFGQRCLIDLINDALALLKEQENEKPVLDEFGRCFLNALKRQLDMKLQMIELLITPEFAEKVVELIEKMFD